MRFGLCTISNREMDVAEILGLAGKVGYDGVEVWGGDHVGAGDRETCESIRKLAASHGLDIPVYGSYLRPGTPDFEGDLDHELAVASRLGATFIRVWPGTQEHGSHESDHWEHVVADLSLVTDRASALGLAVTVEKHEGTLSNTRAGARELIEAVNDPNCGLNWQPLFSMEPGELLDEAAALAPLSNNVHMQAVSERGSMDRCYLVDSFFGVGAVLDTFRRAGFDGYVNVEFVRPDTAYATTIAADLDYLTSHTA
jgi:sugar phosphate isomerase/epimerase